MKFERSKEWWAAHARSEPEAPIGAGAIMTNEQGCLLLTTARVLRALLTYSDEGDQIPSDDARMLLRDLDSALSPYQPSDAPPVNTASMPRRR